MPTLAKVGDFCPNTAVQTMESCKANINKTSLSSARPMPVDNASNAKLLEVPFAETKGTLFYRRRTPENEIIETLALIAESSRISSLARVKGHKEDTIIAWIRYSAEHGEAIEEVLIAEYATERGQLDGLWAYVQNKGKKKTIHRRTKVVSSGDLI
jgi:hypothetical protein